VSPQPAHSFDDRVCSYDDRENLNHARRHNSDGAREPKDLERSSSTQLDGGTEEISNRSVGAARKRSGGPSYLRAPPESFEGAPAERLGFSGVGPAHVQGVHRGGDAAKGRSAEQLKGARRSGVGPVRPIHPDSPDMA
jgi:hypothetical protein